MALTTNQINDIAMGIIDRLNTGEPQIPIGWAQLDLDVALAMEAQDPDGSIFLYMFGLVDADTGVALPPRTATPAEFSDRVRVQEIAFWQPPPAAAA